MGAKAYIAAFLLIGVTFIYSILSYIGTIYISRRGGVEALVSFTRINGFIGTLLNGILFINLIVILIAEFASHGSKSNRIISIINSILYLIITVLKYGIRAHMLGITSKDFAIPFGIGSIGKYVALISYAYRTGSFLIYITILILLIICFKRAEGE